MASTLALLQRLSRQSVDFVLIGGMAAVVHGAASVTEDVDVCVRFDHETLRRLLLALEGTNPRQRMHPARPVFGPSPEPFVGNKNLYLVTDEGVLDLLGEVIGVGGYEEAAATALELDLGGFSCRVLGLEALIACKRALGRPKDLHVARELETLRARLERRRAP